MIRITASKWPIPKPVTVEESIFLVQVVPIGNDHIRCWLRRSYSEDGWGPEYLTGPLEEAAEFGSHEAAHMAARQWTSDWDMIRIVPVSKKTTFTPARMGA